MLKPIVALFTSFVLLACFTADSSAFGKRRHGNSSTATATVTVETSVGNGCSGGHAGFFQRLHACRASRGNGCSGGQAASYSCGGGQASFANVGVSVQTGTVPAVAPPAPAVPQGAKNNQAPMPREKK